jgi:hypothetical protein
MRSCFKCNRHWVSEGRGPIVTGWNGMGRRTGVAHQRPKLTIAAAKSRFLQELLDCKRGSMRHALNDIRVLVDHRKANLSEPRAPVIDEIAWRAIRSRPGCIRRPVRGRGVTVKPRSAAPPTLCRDSRDTRRNVGNTGTLCLPQFSFRRRLLAMITAARKSLFSSANLPAFRDRAPQSPPARRRSQRPPSARTPAAP